MVITIISTEAADYLFLTINELLDLTINELLDYNIIRVIDQ